MELTKVSQIIERLHDTFDADFTKNMDVVLQYHLSGDDGGDYQIMVNNGTLTIEEGVHASPTVTVKMADKTWLGLFNNTVNPMLAFTSGKIKVSGNFGLAMKFTKIFPQP